MMGDIIDNEEIDKDTAGPQTLKELFNENYMLLTETAVSLKKSYINNMSVAMSLKLAVSLSDNSIEVYQLSDASFLRVCRLSGHAKTLTEVVASSKEDHLIYSSGEDGVIKLWDTRAGGSCVQEYKDEDDVILKPYLSMDLSCNERVLCAGSQLVEDEAYLVFWDKRHTIPLGGYWNTHTDDITQVKFHKEKAEILATGSLDGLVNIFNIFETTEDDALTNTFNLENSVERISWLDETNVACITQSNDLQVLDIRTGDLVNKYSRETVAKSIKRSKGDDCYLVDVYKSASNEHVLLAGSYGGNGNILRSVTIKDKKLRPRTDYSSNKQIVRCNWYDSVKDLLITAGESGIISAWKGGHEDSKINGVHKASRSSKLNRKGPY